MPRKEVNGGADHVPPENTAIKRLRSQLETESGDSRKLLASPTDNPICSIQHDDSLPGLVVVWRDYATSRQLRFVYEYLLQLIELRNISKILYDDTALRTIAADDRSWILQDWMPRAVRAGFRASAHTASTAHFVGVAVNALATGAPAGIALRTFDNTSEARKWLQDFEVQLRPTTPTILIVDDADDTRELLAHLLLREGYETLSVPGPAEAMALLEKVRPSLVILDFSMPQKSGLDVFAEIRSDARLRNVPVIMYSANDSARESAMRAGIDAFILKGSMDWSALHREVVRLAGPGTLHKSLPDVPPARAKDAG
ncbi:MAG TPA: response regulator [Phycisphaerae bacterium]|nr:response regulator [Phycisphaerae bacterium]